MFSETLPLAKSSNFVDCSEPLEFSLAKFNASSSCCKLVTCCYSLVTGLRLVQEPASTLIKLKLENKGPI